MDCSDKIVQAINDFLVGGEVNFNFNEKKRVFTLVQNVNSRLTSLRCIICVEDTSYYVIAICPISAKGHTSEMAEFLTRINFGILSGNFEMDYSDGEIRYKCYVECEDCIPSRETIRKSFVIPLLMMKKYSEGIIAVAFGIETPKEAYVHYGIKPLLNGDHDLEDKMEIETPEYTEEDDDPEGD